MRIVESIIINVLEAIYQSFFSALILTVLFMFAYLYSYDTEMKGKGWKDSANRWISFFKSSPKFRGIFYFVFYTSLVLFRTLLCRNVWIRPLSDVLGGWSLYIIDESSGQYRLSTESVENIILFIPFAFMLVQLFEEKINKYLVIGYVAIISIVIEMCQLFFRLGTFQFSDMFYNTVGGALGVFGYMFWRKIIKKRGCNYF